MITLARLSGRPILPIGFASTKFVRFNTWDRAVVALPFGRGHFVAGDLIWVDRDADAAAQEDAKQALEKTLNDAYARAYKQVGKTQ